MNLDSLTFALSHITYSVTNLSKRSYKLYVSEINSLCIQYGTEAERHLIRCLFSFIDFSSEVRTKDLYQVQYLNQEFSAFLSKPNFVSLFCFAFDNPLHQQKSLRPSSQLLHQVSKVLGLDSLQEVVLALILTHSSNTDTKQFSKLFLQEKLPFFLSAFIEAGSQSKYCSELLHLVCREISDSDNSYKISQDLKEKYIATVEQDTKSIIFSPYTLSSDTALDIEILDQIEMAANIADALFEIGYSFTKSQDQCRSCITQFGVKNLTPSVIARTIGFMVRIPSGFLDPITGQNPFIGPPGGAWPAEVKDVAGGDTGQLSNWNVEYFIATVKELMPLISWKEVIKEFDHPNFFVSGHASLELLVSVLKATFETIPIDFIYSMWRNKEGQLSLISQSLKTPDVLCLAEHFHRTVDISCLKSLPDEENKEIATWRSFDLINILLQLAEEGLQQQVCDLFKYPVTHCPDLLTLGLLQYPKMTNLKQELLSSLFPVFLGSHPNSLQVLQSTWQAPGQQQTTQRVLVLKCMADWYMRDQCDQSRLARVLDVAQDLKALPTLLNGSPHVFVIDLACLASRREYLKLDKWINDKMREHGESFIEALLNFLTQRCPHLVSSQVKEDSFQMKGQQIPQELVNTMIVCLNQAVTNRTSQISQDTTDYILLLVHNFQSYKLKQQYLNQQLPSATIGVGGSVGSFINRPIPSAGSSFNLGLGAGSVNPQSVFQTNLLPGQINQTQQPDSLTNFNMLSNLNSFGMGGAGGTSNPLHPLPLFHQQLQQSFFQAPLQSTPGMPGSPAKSFGGGVQPGSNFNVGGLANQLQNLNLQGNLSSALVGQNNMVGPSSIGSGLGTNFSSRGGALSLSNLSAQAALSQQHNQNRTGQSTLSNLGGLGKNVGSGLSSLLGGINLGGMGVSNLPLDSFAATTTSQPQQVQQGQAGTAASATFAKDIEDEANSYFQRIYNNTSTTSMSGGPLSVEEALELLKNFKNSQKPRENEIFQCMIRNLFEEYRFFAEYPDRELQTTAILFGGIIEQGLITYVALGMALRYVLEALKKPFSSKMYMFGLAALDRFKTKLKDYPQYSQFLLIIQNFPEFPPALKEYIEYGARSMDVPHPTMASTLPPVFPSLNTQLEIPTSSAATAPFTQGTGGSTLPHPTSQSNAGPVAPNFTQTTHGAISRPPGTTVRNSIANATNIDTLLANKEGIDGVMAPTESQQDKVFFIFNNLSQSNMDQKAVEMTEQVGEEFLPWVAQYLVMKRASTEPNFHTLYANFIEFLKNANFTKMVIKETYRNIKVLLRSDKVVANFSDRTLLKNLGHWLGMLLIAKNKPILQVDIDLKSLVYEAYHMGADELLYIVPFIAKIIESAAKSKVFKYPNPWTMGIMNVLGELHQEPDLKLNLKFEIEVLCKSLNVTMDLLEPDHYLKNTSRP